MARAKKNRNLDRQAELPLENEPCNYRPSPVFHGQMVMEAVKRLLRQQKKTLDELVEWMSHPSRRPKPVSLPAARAWFAESKPEKLPNIRDMALIVEFLGDPEPLNEALRPLGMRVILRREQQLLKAAEMMRDEIKQRHRASEAERILTRFAIEEGWER